MIEENKKYAEPGDMVESRSCWLEKCDDISCCSFGIVIEFIDHVEVPPVYRVMRSDGCITKEWADEVYLVEKA